MAGLKEIDRNSARFYASPKRHAKPDSRKVSDDFCSKKQFFESISENGPLLERFPPKKLFSQPSTFSALKGTPKTPGVPEKPPSNTPSPQAYQDPGPDLLLAKMEAKQTKLAELQEQQRLVEFEILEIQALLQGSLPGQTTPLILSENGNERDLSGSRSTTALFFDHGPNELRKTVSSFFQSKSSSKSDLRHQASAFFSKNMLPNPELKNKASMMLNTTLSEVKEKLDQQQTDLESLTRKGTHLAREIFTSLSPKKPEAPDSSFTVDNLVEGKDVSILLSEDGSFDDGQAVLASLGPPPSVSERPEVLYCSIIDIDDYESSSDEC